MGIIGIAAAFKQLLEMGWVTGKLPRLVAVQPSGCAPIVKVCLYVLKRAYDSVGR